MATARGFATGIGGFERFRNIAVLMLSMLVTFAIIVIYFSLAQYYDVPGYRTLRANLVAPAPTPGAVAPNEVVKQLLQFAIVTVLGGAVAYGWKYYEFRRGRYYDERTYIGDIFLRTRKAYQEIKLARRMFRIFDKSKNILKNAHVIEKELTLAISECRDFLKIMQESQLVFKSLRREAELAQFRITEVFVDWNFLQSSYSKAEKSIRSALSEFEEEGREQNGTWVFSGKTKMYDLIKPGRDGFDRVAEEMDQVLDLISWVLASDHRLNRRTRVC